MRFNRKGMNMQGWEKDYYDFFFEQDKYEKRENGYGACKEYIRSVIQRTIKERDESFLGKLNSINTKRHRCRFNDGDQTCDCYIQAINDVKKKVL